MDTTGWERRLVSSDNSPAAISTVMFALLDKMGLQLVQYLEPGEEIETSHGRSYYSAGRIKYVVEPKE